jgi:hypothetical protein
MDIAISTAPSPPPGTRIIAHEKPDQHASWDPHGVDGYYLGPVLDHYRCYQVHITKTRGMIIVDTVEFSPLKTAMLQTSSKDLATIPALEMSNTHFRTQLLRLLSVTLELPSSNHFTTFQAFSR